MRQFRLAFLGFGNVGKALARLLLLKQDEMRSRYNIAFKVTGIATGSRGKAVDGNGIDLEQALKSADIATLSTFPIDGDEIHFIEACKANVLFESIPVNYANGQPALDAIRYALEKKMHAITANKGPVIHGYRELTDLARANRRKFFFEATVMDGAPIFSMFRDALPGANLLGFRGVLNSTTNMILSLMERGKSFDSAVAYCQKIGIAETDPSGDIDGWDAAIKVALLVSVLMDTPMKASEVDRTGIREINFEQVMGAEQVCKRWKLICSAWREEETIRTRVSPEMIDPDSPFYEVDDTTSLIEFETDVLGLLTLKEVDPGPHTTAYGMFADFLNAVRSD